MNLPKLFIDNITTIWGIQGSLWLKQLPNLINFFCTQWQLTAIQPFDNLSYNYVARAFSNYYKCFVVLKIGIPSAELIQEMKALEFYDGQGCVKLLSHDYTNGGMLLALIQPGITLKSFFPEKDTQAVEHACAVIKNYIVSWRFYVQSRKFIGTT